MVSLPNLIESQIKSYQWFLNEGLAEILKEICPIEDFTGNEMELAISDCYLDEPKYDELTAKEKNISYDAPLRAQASLLIKKTGEVREQEIFLADFPIMTDRGTFIINGVERVVVSQLIRSPGAFFTMEYTKGRKLFGAKVIPNRGAWLEMETDMDGAIWAKIDRKRKIPVTSLLRVFGLEKEKDILKAFKGIDDGEVAMVKETLAKDPATTAGEAYKEIYKRLRPGDLATTENAKQMVDSIFFSNERYDFGRVGRYRLNLRLDMDKSEDKEENRILSKDEIVKIIGEIIRLSNDPSSIPDDIDHLGNRRLRGVGELVQNKVRVGLARMVRNIKDRMSTCDVTTVVHGQLVNPRPVAASIKEFFSSSQLSQFMDQVNPLAELEHKRRLSAMGPGGLTRERAGFEVRDVHNSHYGRICPVQTPEGPNIGLVGHLACYARVNDYGFLETPYRIVQKTVKVDDKLAENRITREDVKDSAGKVLLAKGKLIEGADLLKLKNSVDKEIKVLPFITGEVRFLNAIAEEQVNIAHARIDIDEYDNLIEEIVEARVHTEATKIETTEVDYVDVSAKQCISVATSLIPFLEHDDANRALMGSNMQRQAVSCIVPDAPLVGTGLEDKAAADSGQVVLAGVEGEIVEVDGAHIVLKEKAAKGKRAKRHSYPLQTFAKSNAFTSMNQVPRVMRGQMVKKGDLLADGASTDHGELALGKNVLMAFMPWEGFNFEDAIIVSERLRHVDGYSSVHIEEFSVDVRDTKLGPEVVTRDIPNIGEDRLKNLDETGIIRIGAEVSSGDILVGKVTLKGEGDLTAEERLLRAIFGEKSRDVKDTSLYVPHGKSGKIVDIKIFSREQGDKLQAGVIQQIQISVAQLRKISVGDKLAGRHGNKGVISKVAAMEDMPYLPDGTPVDVILTPLGVPSRMNLGQIFETHLGWAAQVLGYKAASPSLNGVTANQIKAELRKAGLPEDGKIQLVSGKSGIPFTEKTMVGYMYIMKLNHLIEDKMHMRSIGPYSLITQQPLGGKAQFGGQRFGEMEVWALEGYGAAHTLQEMLTIKSDDVLGRSRAYESIIKGEPIKPPNIPAAFHVLVNELKALALEVNLLESKTNLKKNERIKRDDETGLEEKSFEK
ncbi:DNA-directed RNA polymerase subunit beta [bacterium]|nr:DNA-directed RNA polymerase subunit beta [bacterium]MBT4251029.1 DNA-directed RNA polymerase subunit beta [bacterium]MBT4597934.1 DNA-directed RNA polymerase subunit beta [bacterium]MBT6753378.1 DNA-directed RNA polymerase subunit beta [bacterium]MBT7037201.1 DNA-directed RNA polymerase subunit beta [bacterium]